MTFLTRCTRLTDRLTHRLTHKPSCKVDPPFGGSTEKTRLIKLIICPVCSFILTRLCFYPSILTTAVFCWVTPPCPWLLFLCEDETQNCWMRRKNVGRAPWQMRRKIVGDETQNCWMRRKIVGGETQNCWEGALRIFSFLRISLEGKGVRIWFFHSWDRKIKVHIMSPTCILA